MGTKMNSDLEKIELSEFQRKKVDEIIQLTGDFKRLEEATTFLKDRFEEYANADLSEEDKDFLLTFITVYKEGFIFVINNDDLFIPLYSVARRNSKNMFSCAASSVGLIASFVGLATATGGIGLVVSAVGFMVAPTSFGLSCFG